MNLNLLKSLTSHLPLLWQQELKRLLYRHQIRRRKFEPHEPEYFILDSMISAGDWVVDVGANIGQYTQRFSDLVGPEGRVIAIEPVPETFALLAANVLLSQHSNVTLLNVAASDKPGIASMQIPHFATGLTNYYEAKLSNENNGLRVFTATLDALAFPRPIKLMKIDAEGHDPAVLRGAETILQRDHPILIVELGSSEVAEYLRRFGYSSERLASSPNTLFRWSPK